MDHIERTLSNEEIGNILRGVRSCTLPRASWTHAAHLAAAVGLLAECTLAEAEIAMPSLIQCYNEASGVANTQSSGYHHTITLASLRGGTREEKCCVAWTVLRAADLTDLSVRRCAAACSVLVARELLFTPRARREWVPPDLRALPF